MNDNIRARTVNLDRHDQSCLKDEQTCCRNANVRSFRDMERNELSSGDTFLLARGYAGSRTQPPFAMGLR
jgi:hypothetical protein